MDNVINNFRIGICGPDRNGKPGRREAAPSGAGFLLRTWNG